MSASDLGGLSGTAIRRPVFITMVMVGLVVLGLFGYRRLPKYEMVEFVCDNNREFTDDKGVVRMKVQEK